MTDRSTRFGGAAGTVVFHFLNPADWGSLLPAGIGFGLILVATAAVAYWLKLPLVVTILLSTLAMSPLVGRLTLAASHGDMKAGLLSRTEPGAVKGFVVRYGVLNAVWIVPVFASATALFGSFLPTRPSGPPASWLAAGPAVGGILLFLVAAVGSIAAHLVAARAKNLAGCFTPEPWQWVASRRQDLPGLLAVTVGGSLLFLGLTMPFFFLLGALLARGNSNVAAGVVGLGCFLGWSSIPVFTSRMLGAFVEVPSDAPGAVWASVLPEPEAPSGPPAPPPLDIEAALTRLSAQAQVDLPSAIDEALLLRKEAPQSSALAALLTKLYLQSQQVAPAVTTGGEAIALALAEGAEAVALELFAQLIKHRKALKLSGQDWDGLARAFLSAGKFSEAAWCFVSAGAAGTDATRWLKGMVSAGDGAAKAGQLEVASNIYSHVLKKASATPSADYCRSALDRLKPKLKAKPAA
jgi:hypothetical protein